MLVCNPRLQPRLKSANYMQTLSRSSAYQTYWLFNVHTQFIRKGHRPRTQDDAEFEYGCEYLEETRMVVSPCTWLVRLGFWHGLRLKWLSSSSYGWQTTLDTIRTVPDDALIVQLCETGNVPSVKHMLSNGQASVRDVDSQGWTPLHVSRLLLRLELPIKLSFDRLTEVIKYAKFAAMKRHSTLCQVLIDAGADAQANAQRNLGFGRYTVLDACDIPSEADMSSAPLLTLRWPSMVPFTRPRSLD